jgi:hypothetical protein
MGSDRGFAGGNHRGTQAMRPKCVCQVEAGNRAIRELE